MAIYKIQDGVAVGKTDAILWVRNFAKIKV